MYGDALQVKYFEDNHGISYFLSLHQRYLLIFIIETTKLGTLEASLLKSISIPDNEMSENCLEIVLTGSDKIYLRDDSNAYEIIFNAENDDKSLLDHCIPYKTSLIEFIIAVLSRQDINRLDIYSLMENLASFSHLSDFKSTLSLLNDYKSSVDVYAIRAIFSALIRHKIEGLSLPATFVKDLMDFQILNSLKSDSQVYF